MSVPENQDEVITLCQAGHALALRGGVEQALREYERALALDPRCAPALFNRGTPLLRSDRATEALECFEHLAAMAPAMGGVHLARGNALAALGRRASALACFEEAIRCEPAEPLAHCNRGAALLAHRPAPVLTCLGTTFAGRVAASVLESAGLPELVAGNLDEYEALALALASDSGRLSVLRARLAAQHDRPVLCSISSVIGAAWRRRTPSCGSAWRTTCRRFLLPCATGR